MNYLVTFYKFNPVGSTRSLVVYTLLKMSVLNGFSKADFKTASDGLLELPEERLRSIMRSEPMTSVYHVEQTPFARSVIPLLCQCNHMLSVKSVMTFLYFHGTQINDILIH